MSSIVFSSANVRGAAISGWCSALIVFNWWSPRKKRAITGCFSPFTNSALMDCIAQNITNPDLKTTLNALLSTNSMNPKLFGAPLSTNYSLTLSDKYLAAYVAFDLFYAKLFDVDFSKVEKEKQKVQRYKINTTIDFGTNRNGFLPLTEIHPDYFKNPIADQEKLSNLLEKLNYDKSIEDEDDEKNKNTDNNEEIDRSGTIAFFNCMCKCNSKSLIFNFLNFTFS